MDAPKRRWSLRRRVFREDLDWPSDRELQDVDQVFRFLARRPGEISPIETLKAVILLSCKIIILKNSFFLYLFALSHPVTLRRRSGVLLQSTLSIIWIRHNHQHLDPVFTFYVALIFS